MSEKKKRFREQILPALNKIYNELDELYIKVNRELKEDSLSHFILKLKKDYYSKTNAQLLGSIKPHPKSIALAQAAMESGWGTSRFFLEAKNIFGVWSFNTNDQRIKAGETRKGKQIWVRKYDSFYDLIKDYYKVLANGRAYSKFRQLKMIT